MKLAEPTLDARCLAGILQAQGGQANRQFRSAQQQVAKMPGYAEALALQHAALRADLEGETFRLRAWTTRAPAGAAGGGLQQRRL